MHPRRSLRHVWLLVGLVLLLSGCGQKGDLYQPEDKQSAVETVTALVNV